MIIYGDDVKNTGTPWVNLFLVTINCFVFLWMVGAHSITDQLFITYGNVPARFLAHPGPQEYWTLISSMFMHADFFHILGNMWVLMLFGDNVEDRLGHFTYLIFYLACGIFASMVQILGDPTCAIPCVGASGAIAGVMGAFIALHPDANCFTWWGDDCLFLAFKTHKIPAFFIIVGWFFLQLILGATTSIETSHIGYKAHIGGFCSALVLLAVLKVASGKEFSQQESLEELQKPKPPATAGQYIKNMLIVIMIVALCLVVFEAQRLFWPGEKSKPTSVTASETTKPVEAKPQPTPKPISHPTQHSHPAHSHHAGQHSAGGHHHHAQTGSHSPSAH